MNKAKVIGLTVTVLAVIGGVAVYNWVRKPKKNSEGFFNASGTGKGIKKCYCKDSKGNIYLSDSNKCKGADTCVATTGVID